ncbi:Na+/H+ antiporter NhaA [Jannaschia rubra]|uniref:Na+/H+ antiporter NhaA n=1 Tax=Jannaschia rubra TaxID=282197 RepID=UPI0024926862|nr:Na+/H+ antiporter NhaA [Jannaschia rubra]
MDREDRQIPAPADVPSDRPQSARDFLTGIAGARRSVLWYETFSDRSDPAARAILRRVLSRAEASKTAQVAVRVRPEENDEVAMGRARAAIAAGWQGAFFDMQRDLTGGDAPSDRPSFVDAARRLGLDTDRFTDDLTSGRTRRRVAEDLALAQRSGTARGPLLFIDGRRYSGVLDEAALTEALERPLGLRLRTASADFFEWAASGGLVLIVATLAALAVVNLGWHEGYERLRQSVVSLGWNDAIFALSVEQWVNDGLMTVFFLIVGIEIKREVVAGELSNPSRAALPIAAALGGMIVPALIYAAINLGQNTVHGWGVPMATDIAFTLGLLALLGRRVPASLRVLVSALAIADDLGAILVIAVFYSSGIAFGPLVVAAAILAAMVGLNRARVYALWPYVLLGLLLWAAVFAGGLHATLAGVLTALAIPSRKPAAVHGVAAQTAELMRAEAERAETGEGFANQSVERLTEIVDRLREPGVHLQKTLENWTSFLILPLFAFFNTGILLAGSGFAPFSAPSLGVILGLVVGKPVGICLAAFVVLRAGWATKSDEVTWRHLIGAGCLAGIGFTMSIFIADAAFDGPALDGVKIGVLLASTVSAAIGLGILWEARPAERKGTT